MTRVTRPLFERGEAGRPIARVRSDDNVAQLTVGQLIEQLQKLSADDLVFCCANHGEYQNLAVFAVYATEDGAVHVEAD